MELLLYILDEIDKFIQKLYEPLDRKMREEEKILRENIMQLEQESSQIETQLEHIKVEQIKAEQVCITNLRAHHMAMSEPWVNNSVTYTEALKALMPLGEITDLIFDDKSKQADVTVDEYKPFICKCCGAPINRETMTCEYCGVQYGKGIDEH